MTVYLDVIWALNFLFDSLLLYLTAIILKKNIPVWRFLIGGFIGSLIILMAFTPLSTFSGNPFTKLLFSLLMTYSVFGYKRWRFFLSALLTLYLSTFVIGGFLIGMHFFMKFDSQLNQEIFLSSIRGFGDPISWLFVLLGFPVAWHFSKRRIEGIEMTNIQYDQLVGVELIFDTDKFFFKGLVDSGNQLYDPLSKMPVMIVSLHLDHERMPEEILKMAADPDSIIMGKCEVPEQWQKKLKIIPCRVVGQEHQLIIAVKPDFIVIIKGSEQIKSKSSLVSFTMQQLSPDDSFQCIVHPKMLIGKKEPVTTAKVG